MVIARGLCSWKSPEYLEWMVTAGDQNVVSFGVF